MAHALGPARESEILRSHPKMSFRAGPYDYEIVSDGQQSLYRVTDGKETLTEQLLYAFGKGHDGQTYIYRHSGKLYEARVSYYTAIDRLDWTIGDALELPPSLEAAMGRDVNSDEARNCFSCHGTAAVVNTKLELDRLIPGVTCEACHGPGEKHAVLMLSDVSADSELFIFNPKTLDPETLSQQFCGACHRGVDAVAMMPDLGGINNIRFQPYRLYNSRGHDPKDARLACTACHDPHVDLKKGDALYDSKCTTCHAAGHADQSFAEGREKKAVRNRSHPRSGYKSCPVRNNGCVSCHMPKMELPGAHFQFTDHRIRIVRPGDTYPY